VKPERRSNSRSRAWWLTLLVLPVWTVGLGAQQPPRDTVQLAEIVITPTKVATARSSLALAVTVLQGESLRRRGIRLVAEALRDVAGATVVQTGSFGALTSLFLRGGQSDYTQVLVDGVPINQPGGAVNLADLTTDNLDRIEVVRGPASVLYGSDAVTGVVQVFTHRGQGPMRVEGGLESGWFDAMIPGPGTPDLPGRRNSALRWETSLAGGSPTVGYSLSASRTATDGLYTTDGSRSFDNSYQNTALSGLLTAQPDSRSQASLMVRYGDHRFHYPTDGAGRLSDANAFDHGRSTALAVEVGRFLRPALEARLVLADYSTEGGTDDAPDSPADTVGFYAFQSLATVERRRAEARANLYGRSGVLTLGAQVERQSQQSFSQSQSSFGNSTDRLDVRRLNHAYYAQVQGSPRPALSLNAGLRLDGSETFGRFVTYRGGLTYRLAPGWRLRSAVGTGFKEPTFFQNFATGFVRGNPKLKPEHSFNWEVGAEVVLPEDRVRLAVTYFSQRFRDLVDFTFAPATPTDPNYYNVAGARASGVEIEAGSSLPGGLAIQGTYTELRTRVTDPGFDPGPGALLEAGRRLLRRPDRQVNVTVHYPVASRARLGASFRHVGARDDLDYAAFPAQRVVLAAYRTLDLSFEADALRAADRVTTLTLRVDNLFDQRYQEALHFPARGRTLWIGAKTRM
jgi:vitamin B12 transporter